MDMAGAVRGGSTNDVTINTSIGTWRGRLGVADLLRDAEPTVDLHGAGVTPLHLGEELGRFFLFEENAADAATAKIDRQRQANGSRAHNDDLGVQGSLGVMRGLQRLAAESIRPPENLRPGTVRK